MEEPKENQLTEYQEKIEKFEYLIKELESDKNRQFRKINQRTIKNYQKSLEGYKKKIANLGCGQVVHQFTGVTVHNSKRGKSTLHKVYYVGISRKDAQQKYQTDYPSAPIPTIETIVAGKMVEIPG